ncbi:unnamed protein product [Symbiodinium sp. CCMP2592]|nr:unnamed protein product [Symbiodinium sp. CCMP2592]
MLLTVSALLAVALGSAQDADQSQCAVPHRASGGSLLQHAAANATVSPGPFASEEHKGCRKMIHRCLCKDCEDEAQEFYHANWSAWQLGFDICCNSQYNEALCGELAATIFGFSAQNFGPGDRVSDTPDPALAEFCHEAEGLMDAHFAEESFQKDTAAAPQVHQLLQMFQMGFLQKLFSRVGRLSLRKLLYRADRATRRAAIRRHVEDCHFKHSCWEPIGFRLRRFFLEKAEPVEEWSYGQCFHEHASVATYEGGSRSVRSLEGDSVTELYSRVPHEWRLRPKALVYDKGLNFENGYCNVAFSHRIVSLSGGGQLKLGQSAKVFVKVGPDIEKITEDDIRKGHELVNLNLQKDSTEAVGGIFVEDVKVNWEDLNFCGPDVLGTGGIFVDGISVDCASWITNAAHVFTLHGLSLAVLVLLSLST